MSNIQGIDIVFIVLILLMVFHGYVRGFITELFSWAALVVAVLAAIFLHAPGAAYIRGKMMANVPYIPELLAFVGIFLITVIICKILERILKNVIIGANLGVLDKVLGAAFGFVEGIAITALIVFVLSVQPLFDASRIIAGSSFAQMLLPHIYRIPFERATEIMDTVFMGTGIFHV